MSWVDTAPRIISRAVCYLNVMFSTMYQHGENTVSVMTYSTDITIYLSWYSVMSCRNVLMAISMAHMVRDNLPHIS